MACVKAKGRKKRVMMASIWCPSYLHLATFFNISLQDFWLTFSLLFSYIMFSKVRRPWEGMAVPILGFSQACVWSSFSPIIRRLDFGRALAWLLEFLSNITCPFLHLTIQFFVSLCYSDNESGISRTLVIRLGMNLTCVYLYYLRYFHSRGLFYIYFYPIIFMDWYFISQHNCVVDYLLFEFDILTIRDIYRHILHGYPIPIVLIMRFDYYYSCLFTGSWVNLYGISLLEY